MFICFDRLLMMWLPFIINVVVVVVESVLVLSLYGCHGVLMNSYILGLLWIDQLISLCGLIIWWLSISYIIISSSSSSDNHNNPHDT